MQVDGTLDDEKVGSQLASNGNVLDLEKIRENLEKRYVELNIETEILNFESLISQFLEKTSYKIGPLAKFPEFAYFPHYAPNLLAENNTIEIKINTQFETFCYPIAIEVPEGMSFRMVVRSDVTRTPSYDYPCYFYHFPTGNWTQSGLANDITLRVGSCTLAECALIFSSKGTFTIECYENNSDKPAYVKIIEV